MLIALVSLLGGLVLLVLAADWLVDGAVGIARRFGVSPVVVGLTIVAYGTSFPEFVVSVLSGLRGVSDFAIGNIVGSNIANIGMVLGATAIVAPFTIKARLIYRRDMPLLAGTTVLAVAFLFAGDIGRLQGAVLLVIALFFTVATLKMGSEDDGDEASDGEDEAPIGKAALMVLVGVIGLLSGAHFMVEGGRAIALHFGISERIIGLTVVAVGTSLPELAASVASAVKGHPGLAVGNVVGSCLFNLTFVLGSAGLISPMRADPAAMFWDLVTVGALTLVMWMMLVTGRRLSRAEGGLLVLTYVSYLTYLVVTTVGG